MGTTNVVRYDGYFYLLPQRLGAVRWGEEDVAALPGVIVVSNARDAFAIAEGGAASRPEALAQPKAASRERHKGRSVPLLRKTVGNYNVVEYEGWFYGLPHSLGPIDLQTVDVIEIPGVIRDVSADVVERVPGNTITMGYPWIVGNVYTTSASGLRAQGLGSAERWLWRSVALKRVCSLPVDENPSCWSR